MCHALYLAVYTHTHGNCNDVRYPEIDIVLGCG